jgi:hypothetical protein
MALLLSYPQLHYPINFSTPIFTCRINPIVSSDLFVRPFVCQVRHTNFFSTVSLSSKHSFSFKIAGIGGVLAMIILGFLRLYIRRRKRVTHGHELIMQFNLEQPNGTQNRILPKNHISDHPPDPFSPSEPHEKQDPPTLPTNSLNNTYPTPPIMPSQTNPATPRSHSVAVPHPQSTTAESAVFICQLCDHVPIEGIGQIIDVLRAERRRRNRDLVDVALEWRGQSRISIDRETQPNGEQAASESIVLGSSMSIGQVTPPPSVSQDVPPPRYSRVN